VAAGAAKSVLPNGAMARIAAPNSNAVAGLCRNSMVSPSKPNPADLRDFVFAYNGMAVRACCRIGFRQRFRYSLQCYQRGRGQCLLLHGYGEFSPV
jgi:hypothetical protein